LGGGRGRGGEGELIENVLGLWKGEGDTTEQKDTDVHTCVESKREMGWETKGVLGWLRLVGSLKLYVSFAECSLFYTALLQKRSIISRSLLMVATPYRSRKPLTNEIRLQIFGSPDLSVFLIDLLSAGDSVYSRENVLEILGTPVKTCYRSYKFISCFSKCSLTLVIHMRRNSRV